MGKSIRCKIKKRLRTAKRQRVDAMIITQREEEHHADLLRVIEGKRINMVRPKSAFKYPNAPDAHFAQHEVMKPIDFRAESMPMVGYVFRGNRRKYFGEEAEYIKNKAKTSHPSMEIMAGGGSVMSDGRRVTSREAQIIAGNINAPDGAAAVAAAVEADQAAASTHMDTARIQNEAVPEVQPSAGQADHTRRPILKDSRRQERAAEHRPRANTARRKLHTQRAEDTGSPAVAASPAGKGGDTDMSDANASPATKVKKQQLKKKAAA